MVSFFICGLLHKCQANDTGPWPWQPCHPISPLPSLTSPDIKTKPSFCSGWQEILGNNISLWKRLFPAITKGNICPSWCCPSLHSSIHQILAHAICLPCAHSALGKLDCKEYSVPPWAVALNRLNAKVSGTMLLSHDFSRDFCNDSS